MPKTPPLAKFTAKCLLRQTDARRMLKPKKSNHFNVIMSKKTPLLAKNIKQRNEKCC